jgi:hypothetical protein
MQKTGKILSFVTPGLGRALTGKLAGSFTLGVSLFAGYVWIMNILFSQKDVSMTIIVGIAVWKIFSSIDSIAVKQIFAIQQNETPLSENELENIRG